MSMPVTDTAFRQADGDPDPAHPEAITARLAAVCAAEGVGVAFRLRDRLSPAPDGRLCGPHAESVTYLSLTELSRDA